MKMYILLAEDLTNAQAVVAAAHAALGCYLRNQNDLQIQEWLAYSFKKIILKASSEDFERAKTIPGHYIFTESSLNNKEVAIALKPREVWPSFIRKMELWNGN